MKGRLSGNALNMKRIGVYGGTFNPVHLGHVRTVLEVQNEFNLDQIFIVPVKEPVHKEIEYDPGSEARCSMLEIAFENEPRITVNRIEIDRESPSYAVLTVADIKKSIPPESELFFILGTDSFNTLGSWKEYEKLVTLVSFIVLKRPNIVLDQAVRAQAGMVLESDNSLYDISSTEIREKLSRGEACSAELGEKLYNYILEKGFYRD